MYLQAIACLLVYCLVECAGTLPYDGYKIYDVNTKDDRKAQILFNLSHNPAYDFFSFSKNLNNSARIMAPPSAQTNLEQLLKDHDFEFNVINADVGWSLRLHKRSLIMPPRTTEPVDILNKFNSHENINQYLESLQAKFPSRVSVRSIGKSYEGRDMKTITINNGDRRRNKKVIFVDAGIHAREWIAPAAALYAIYQLVENYAANADLLGDYEWIILPVFNPDGYEYSHSGHRLWRKTRAPSWGGFCFGADANRNFGFHWSEVGASRNPCSDIFQGHEKFSEIETQAVRDQLLKLTGRGKFYLTLHSYGRLLLYPWGFTSDLPKNVADLDEVAKAGQKAMKGKHNVTYEVGSSTRVLYAAAGGSDDYALGVANFSIAITMELAGGGNSGFDPPTEQIKPFVTEAWTGIRAMAKNVINMY